MSKSVLISIQPKWCELIASGKKTVEVRKTKPKLQTPFKCYIYCTKNYSLGAFYNSQDLFAEPSQGKVIGEFVCDKLIWVIAHPDVFAGHPLLYKQAIMDACLTENEAEKFSNGKDLYGWHISDLVIYDKPKELREFTRFCEGISGKAGCRGCEYYYEENNESIGHYEECCCDNFRPLKRPPQSWCYVEAIL